MKRRTFLRGLAGGLVGGGACLLTACAGAQTSTPAGSTGEAATGGAQAPATTSGLQEVRWRMATSWNPSLDIINGGAVRIARQVNAMTGGRFTIDVIDQSRPEKVDAHSVLDAVGRGDVEAGHSASYYYLDKSPAFAFATTVPFGLNAQQQTAWLYHGGGLELLRPLFARHGNVINFPAGNTGVQMGGWFKEEVYTQDDLKRVKMRIPGIGAQVMEALGVETFDLPAAEIESAFASGQINAAEFVGPHDDQKLGLFNAAQFYYFPGWWEPGTGNDAYVNLDRWNALSKEDQAIFETACRDAHSTTLAEFDAKNPEALAWLLNPANTPNGQVQLRFFNDRILAPARRATAELHQENAAKSPDYAAIYTQWEEFRGKISRWHWYNEISYMNSVIREFSP